MAGARSDACSIMQNRGLFCTYASFVASAAFTKGSSVQCRRGAGHFLRGGPRNAEFKELDDFSDAETALSKNRHKSLAYGLHIEKFASPASRAAVR